MQLVDGAGGGGEDADAFIDAVINFLIVGFVLFLIVKAYNAMKNRLTRTPEAADVELLTEIRDLLRSRA